ncbi:MAG: hypothetical protein ACLFM7_12705 [Bacteroidales bacterium]
MRQNYVIEIIRTELAFSKAEQRIMKNKLEPLLLEKGVINMCLEANNLYLEYDSNFINMVQFKDKLKEVGFPVLKNSKERSRHTSFS